MGNRLYPDELIGMNYLEAKTFIHKHKVFKNKYTSYKITKINVISSYDDIINNYFDHQINVKIADYIIVEIVN